jgi:hypothetical protein
MELLAEVETLQELCGMVKLCPWQGIYAHKK